MAEIEMYGKNDMKEAAKKILETGEEIRPTDEHGVLYVTTNPELIDALTYFKLDGKVFFIGHKK